MSPIYRPRRTPDNSGAPWQTTARGLRFVNLADVEAQTKEENELEESDYPVLDAFERRDGSGLAVWC